MNEIVRHRMYRLYGLAENAYFDELKKTTEEGKEQELERKSIVVSEEPEDHDGDEWTMLRSDYNLIRDIMEVYDENTDFVTVEISEDNPYVNIVPIVEHVKLDSCIHRGLGMGPEWSMCTYCTIQKDHPDDIHRNMDCKNCPDFVAYEYEMKSI